LGGDRKKAGKDFTDINAPSGRLGQGVFKPSCVNGSVRNSGSKGLQRAEGEMSVCVNPFGN